MSGAEFLLYTIGFLYITVSVLAIIFSIRYIKKNKNDDE